MDKDELLRDTLIEGMYDVHKGTRMLEKVRERPDITFEEIRETARIGEWTPMCG